MASRRTRIKGIANIPQRRKQTNDNEVVTEEIMKIGENQKIEKPNLNIEETSKQTSEKHNLNSQVGIDNNAENQFVSSEINETPKTDAAAILENQQIDRTNNDNKLEKHNLNTDVTGDNTEIIIENSSKIDDSSQNDVLVANENNQNKMTVERIVEKPPPIRRKFIKPAVAIGALNRKLAKEIDKKEVKNDIEIKNKIVVLDQKIIEHENVITTNDITSQEKGAEIEILQQSDEIVKIPQSSPTKEKYSAKTVPNNVVVTNTETEYPIPPPSPNKNRSRIKAIPRFSQRHTSFSASESEDESKRNNRHRNDSVCSTTSTVVDNTAIPEILPQKPKEFHSLIQKKCRRTEQSRKLAEARRDFQIKFGSNKPDRQKLTMMDLIFYNPTTNLMSDTKRKRDNPVITENKETEQQREQKEEEEENVDNPSEKPNSGNEEAAEEEEEAEALAPQIRIDAQGEIVVDEQSLVIENKTNKKNWEALQNSQIVDGNFETGYGIYKRCKRSKDWTKQETLKFYKALNTLGTDFTLMSEFFPRRSRRELKMKFKKEERINKQFIDRALLQPCSFDYEEFKQEVDMEEKEMAEIERQKQIDSQLKKEIGRKRKSLIFKAGQSDTSKKASKTVKNPKKRRLDIMNVLSESDADESEIDSDDENSNNDRFLQNMQRPTRSGRVPKLLNRYRCDDNTKTEIENNQNGSIMFVERTTPDGGSIFKVFMVGDDTQNKIENGAKNLKSICSLRAELSENDDVDDRNENITIKEQNITIPADSNDNTENLY